MIMGNRNVITNRRPTIKLLFPALPLTRGFFFFLPYTKLQLYYKTINYWYLWKTAGFVQFPRNVKTKWREHRYSRENKTVSLGTSNFKCILYVTFLKETVTFVLSSCSHFLFPGLCQITWCGPSCAPLSPTYHVTFGLRCWIIKRKWKGRNLLRQDGCRVWRT